jgi:hypothetical protein
VALCGRDEKSCSGCEYSADGELANYVFLIDGNADGGATLRNAQEVRKAALKLALANDVLVKMRDALNRIPVRQ